MIAFLRGVWHRAYMRGFTAGFRDGLTAGLVETVAEHSNVALIPDDVIAAFWVMHEAMIARPKASDDYLENAMAKAQTATNLYQALERHLIPEEAVNE